MSKRKKLSREQYEKKFKDQMNRYNYIPQEGEIIVQCKEKYPLYWFISNKAYLFSVYRNNIKIIKPNYRPCGKDKKEHDWYYTYKESNKKHVTKISQHKLIAEHFCECKFTNCENENKEIHHIQKRSLFNAHEGNLCNKADNLQTLPYSVHQDLTTFSHKTVEEHEKNIKEKVEDPKLPCYAVDLESYLKILQKINPNGVISIMDGDKVKAYQMKDIKFF